MKILSGTSNTKLSKDISKNLKLKLINTNIRRFADGEIYIEINEKIRGNSDRRQREQEKGKQKHGTMLQRES